MATVHVTPNLDRHVATETASVGGATVQEVLREYFQKFPALRSYVLEDSGCLRKHMNIFVDGQAIQDRQHLSDPVSDKGEIYILQALSGG